MTLIDEQPAGGGAGAGVLSGPDPFVQMAFVDQALNDLDMSDLEQLDDEWFAQLVGSANRLAARFDAFQVDVAAAASGRGRGRSVGFFSTKSYIKHHAQLDGVEARGRMQTVRMFELLPEWADAAHAGEVGVDQTRLMARVAGNPRIQADLVANCEALLCDAMFKSFDEFERLVRDFARAADPDGAKSIAERNRDRRDFQMVQRPDGGWTITGQMGSLQGAEIAEIFAHFVDAEFATDWAAAVEIDPENPIDHLPRHEPNRRADALTAALLAAAQAPGDGKAPLPTLSVLLDEHTMGDFILDTTPDPARYRDMVCRTDNGNLVDLSEAASMACWAYIRRAVRDGKGVVTELGRRSRLFRGSNREAGLLLQDRCVWPGCDRPVRICQADHSVGWLQDGETDPHNCGALCGAHNRLKHRGGFTARRDTNGNWSIRDTDGNPVG